MFLVGLVAVLVDVLPFFAGADNRPLILNLLSFLAPLGLFVALLGLLASVRASVKAGRAAERSLTSPPPAGSAETQQPTE